MITLTKDPFANVPPNFMGLSTDEKPTSGVQNGSGFTEMDTGDKYVFNAESGEWLKSKSGDSGGGGGGSSVTEKDVNFYDYDGTLLHSYTLAEANALTELPAVPEHEGLVFQEWNWSLEDVKALTYPMDVGANYITDDGATRYHIQISSEWQKTVIINFGQNVKNGVSVNWGDGSEPETSDVTSGLITLTHTYNKVGDYTISLLPLDNCNLRMAGTISSVNFAIGGSNQGTDTIYRTVLKKVEIGKNVSGNVSNTFCYMPNLETISTPTSFRSFYPSAGFANSGSLRFICLPRETTQANRAFESTGVHHVSLPKGFVGSVSGMFSGAKKIFSVSLPDGITTIDSYAFSNATSLKRVSMPRVTMIGDFSFNNCYGLENIVIPDGVTSIGNYAFSNCNILENITIPDSVTSIGSNAFGSCIKLKEMVLPTSLTSIGSSCFNQCQSIFELDIPSGVTVVPSNAFSSCHVLSSVKLNGDIERIDSGAFSSCYALRVVDFTACTAVPALASTNAFNGIPADCVFLVPAALVDEWKAATNWSTYAAQIVGA